MSDVEKVTDFILKYSTYKDKEALTKRVQGHLLYKTARVILDGEGDVCAVCLWNISSDGICADVLDFIIREDFRKRDIMRRVLIDALKVWKDLKYLRYNRDYNDDGHDRWEKPKIFSVERFLRRKA